MKLRGLLQDLRIKNRRMLIASVVCFQTFAVGLGAWGVIAWVRRELDTNVHQSAAAENARIVDQFRGTLMKNFDGPIAFKTPEWEKAQTLIEHYGATRGGTLMLLDSSGRVLCHPRLRKDPTLRVNDYSVQPIKIDGTSTKVALGDVQSIRPRTATSDELSGKSALALISVPELGVTVLFHQPTETLAVAGDRITAGLLAWSLVGGAGVIVLSVVGCMFLVSRYDSFHEQASTKLDHEVRRRTRQSLAIRNGLIFGLAKLAEERDNDTGRHLERIARYCTILAFRLRKVNPEIDAAWIERLALASSMHDIGKVGIPDGILLKQGPLTPDERAVMEKHTVIGAETLRQIRDRVGGDDLLTMAMQVTRHHHERWDGTGYPDRIEGLQIPLAARIIAIADVYDAITSQRVYKPAMSHEQAVEMIRSGAGKQYDPELVEVFLSVAGQFQEACQALAPEGAKQASPKTSQFIEPRLAGLASTAGSVESVG